MDKIRENIGICPQENCLFNLLTVRETIQFFARLKGVYSKVSREEAEEDVDRAIRDIALAEKRNTLAKNLSGGMKRKLSVAIAFCGGSKTVILDEPTSGMYVRLFWISSAIDRPDYSHRFHLLCCTGIHFRDASLGTLFVAIEKIDVSFLLRISWMRPTF